MADLQRIKDEHLTCTICHEVFKQPITLSCLHHFCKDCLVNFTKTKPEIILQGCLPCATCRQLTSVPDPQKPLEEWAEQLHSGFFVQGLIDALDNKVHNTITADPGNNETRPEDCYPCLEEGDGIPATKWCTDCETALCARCFRLHQRFESTRDHLLCDVTDFKTRGKPKVKCKQHSQKRLELFCQDCGDPICSTCSTTVHRQCTTVTSLSESKLYMRHALEVKAHQIENKNKILRGEVSKNKRQTEKLFASLTTANKELENVTQKLQNLIFARKEILKEKLEKVEKYDLSELRNLIKTNTEITEKNTAKLNDITAVLQSGSDMDMCLEYMKTRAADEEREETKCQSIVTQVTFTTEVGRIIEEIDKYGLGHIVTTTSQITTEKECAISATSTPSKLTSSTSSQTLMPTISPEINLTDSKQNMSSKTGEDGAVAVETHAAKGKPKISLNHTLDTKISNDKREPDISDVIAMKIKGIEVIVVADHSNRNIKSFYKQGKKQRHSWLRLEDTPNNMTQVEGNTIAVTVPLLQQIILASVTPDLSYRDTINTKKVYNGLVSVNPSTFIAGTNNGVDVISISGQILQSITKHPNGSRLFTSPYYMAKTPGGLIVITDTVTKRVVFMTEKGEVTAMYPLSKSRRLHYPCGVSCSPQFVFVADSGAKKVIQLSLEGDYMKDVLTSRDGLQCPDGIFAADDKNLCVGDKRYVKTFQL